MQKILKKIFFRPLITLYVVLYLIMWNMFGHICVFAIEKIKTFPVLWENAKI